MKKGRMFRGCILLLTLCIWTKELCFAEGEALPEVPVHVVNTDGERGTETLKETPAEIPAKTPVPGAEYNKEVIRNAKPMTWKAAPTPEPVTQPEIEVTGKKVSRTSSDAFEWTVPMDSEEVTLTVKNVPEKKGPVVVLCGKEKVASDTADATEGKSSKTMLLPETEENGDGKSIVLQLGDYIKKKTDERTGEILDLELIVDWSGKAEEEQTRKDEASVSPGDTLMEEQMKFFLHIIPKAEIEIEEEKEIRDFDNNREPIEIHVKVNRNYGTLEVLNEIGEEIISPTEIPQIRQPQESIILPIRIEQGTLIGDEEKITVRYTNENGEEDEETVSYTRKWQEIHITEPAEGIECFYYDAAQGVNTGADKKVGIRIAGEPGKTVKALLTFSNAKEVNQSMNEGEAFELTYAETQEAASIRFFYEENQEQCEKTFEIRKDGKPDEKTLVFKAYSPVVADPVCDDAFPVIRISNAAPGSRLVLSFTEPETNGEERNREAALDVDNTGQAQYEQDEPFTAGTRITISEEGKPEVILAEAVVQGSDLEEILPEKDFYEISEKTAGETFSIQGKAKPNRAMMATFENDEQPFSKCSFTSDENGEWKTEFATRPEADGNYKVTFQYSGRGTDFQKYVNVIIDTECSFSSEDGRDGVISILEGAKELRFHCGEQDGFEEIRIEYRPDGATNPTLIPATSQDEQGNPLQAEKPDENGFITYNLPEPVQKKDQIIVYLTDKHGNTTGQSGITVEIGTVSFGVTLDGEKPDDTQELYLTREIKHQIGVTGAPGTLVAVCCREKGRTGELITLASLTEGESYTLSQDVLEQAYKEKYDEELRSPKDFEIVLHRTDIEDETEQVIGFTYDTECQMTVDQIGDVRLTEDQDKADIRVPAPAFGGKKITVSGTTEKNARINVAVLPKLGNGEGKETVSGFDGNGQFRFSIEVELKSGSDAVRVSATDAAGNIREYTFKVQRSKAIPIITLTVGAILMMVFLFMFLSTQRKIRQTAGEDRKH